MALCEDTSKLRTPLNEVCISTDIGCVPLVEGKPECSPQPDQIPLAFDQSTSTLWIFNCSTREWIPFKKFTMCELQSVNLDNIKNICDLLNIGVYYDPGTGCQQGSISLGELAEKILDCIKLETKALAVTSSGDKLKIWVEGLDNLPPFYVKGTNIWTEGGSGTEADPLKVVTYDPICKWPTKTQGQVDAAQTKHLGACLDGEMSRVPFPPKVCELPERNQAQVDASNNKKLIACVNGEGVKVPFPKQPCEFPEVTVEQVEAAADKDFIVCVDGQNSKVGIPDGLLTPICENPQITGSQARSKKNLRLLACDGGNVVLFPLPDEMFQGSYMCVPYLEAPPSGAPAEGTGPIRVDCNNDIWFWICDENRWYRVDVGNHNHPNWDAVKNFIANPCSNIRFHGWSEQDNCFTDFEMTPSQLIDFLVCYCTPSTDHYGVENTAESQRWVIMCLNGKVTKTPWGICSYPNISVDNVQATLDAGKSVKVAVCVDGLNRKVDWGNCALPYLADSKLDAIVDDDPTNVNLIACVNEDGYWRNKKIKYEACCPTVKVYSLGEVGFGGCFAFNGGSPGIFAGHIGIPSGLSGASVGQPINDQGKYIQIKVKNTFKKVGLLSVVVHATNYVNIPVSGSMIVSINNSVAGQGLPDITRCSGPNVGALPFPDMEDDSTAGDVARLEIPINVGETKTLYVNWWLHFTGNYQGHIMIHPSVKIYNYLEDGILATGGITAPGSTWRTDSSCAGNIYSRMGF